MARSILRGLALNDQHRARLPCRMDSVPTTDTRGLNSDTANPEPGSGVPDASRDQRREEPLRQLLDQAQARIEQEIEGRWAKELNEQRATWDQIKRAQDQEVAHRVERLDKLVAMIERRHQELASHLSRQAVELALQALCKVCGPLDARASVRQRADLMADLIRQAISQLRAQPCMSIRMSPADLDSLKNEAAGLDVAQRYPQIKLVADPSLTPLGLLLETEHGGLDAGLQTQLQHLVDLWSRHSAQLGERSDREDA